MHKGTLFFALLLFTFNLYPQKIQSIAANDIKNPISTAYGIVFTDAKNSALYILENNKPILLTSSPGCGTYYTYSKDKQYIGFKYIDGNGNQIPSIINLTTKEITRLSSPVKSAGQISFADNGSIAFTMGNDLIVHSNNEEIKYDLGNYSNTAPISPKGNFVIYNNNDDKLFLMNLLTKEKRQISDDSCGYFSPLWSPDGNKILYSSLSGIMKVYDLENSKTYFLGDGLSPSWSNASQLIIYYKNEIKNLQLLNSDLYVSSFDGKVKNQLTSTADQFEVDPSFGNNDSEIVYSLSGNEKIIHASFFQPDLLSKIKNEISVSIKPISFPSLNSFKSTEDVDTLDMPYINQVYDTPDYFNGNWACGPTSSMMVLAYYKVLPEWSIWCSTPSGHYSSYGRYISDAYRFKQIDYSFQAPDPNNKLAKGAFGFMWTGSYSPHSRMVNYYNNHGIAASLKDNPSYEDALKEVNAGRPYTVCVGLTTVGHIVVAHGTATANHTLIFNDPYGNKNISYPSPNGKNVKYDWPGYNNGYQNLQTVYWTVAVNYVPNSSGDTLVDDLDFGKGFYMNNKAPASMYSWKDLNEGYNGHMWFAYMTSSSTVDTCFATWTPNLSRSGYYNLYAYIPLSNAEQATYKIYCADGLKTILINQKQYKDSWADLGKYKFEKGNSGYVRLGDSGGIKGQELTFDAVKWSYVDSIETGIVENKIDNPKEFSLEQNYPNPFNPVTYIRYTVPKSSYVKLEIYDLLGKSISVLVDKYEQAGMYEVQFNGDNLSSGVYIYRLTENGLKANKKLVLLK